LIPDAKKFKDELLAKEEKLPETKESEQIDTKTSTDLFLQKIKEMGIDTDGNEEKKIIENNIGDSTVDKTENIPQSNETDTSINMTEETKIEEIKTDASKQPKKIKNIRSLVKELEGVIIQKYIDNP